MATVIKGIKELQKGLLNQNLHRKATVNTINQMAGIARLSTQQYILTGYNFKANDVRIKLDDARYSRPRAILTASAHRRGLKYFGAVQTGLGVQVSIKKGKTSIRKGAFIARPTGKDYRRRGQSKAMSGGKEIVLKRKTSQAYPTKGLKGPSVGNILRSKDNMLRVNRMVRQRKDTIFMRQLKKLGIV